MLKKIFLILLILIFTINSSFAYNISKKDELVLNKIYKIIDKKFSKESKARKLYFTVKKIKPKFLINKNNKKYNKKIRIYYLLLEIEKYLEKKLNIKTIFSWNNFKDNSLKTNNWKNWKFKKIEKKIIKKINNNILRTRVKNWVLVKYIKKEEKYIPKNTPKNIKPKILEKFLVIKITDKNLIIIKYYKKNKILKITWTENYSCNSLKLNSYFKNNLLWKKIILENLKKTANKNIFKAEIYIKDKKINNILLENNICK